MKYKYHLTVEILEVWKQMSEGGQIIDYFQTQNNSVYCRQIHTCQDSILKHSDKN